MSFEEKHPAEMQFRQALIEVEAFLTKYENKYLDGDEKEAMKQTLDYIYQKIGDIREERFFQYAGEECLPVNMPEEEKDMQLELFTLQRRILSLSEKLQ